MFLKTVIKIKVSHKENIEGDVKSFKKNCQVIYYGSLIISGLHGECGNQSVATVADRGTVLTATILVSHCLTSDCLLQKSVRRKVFNHIFYIHIHSFRDAYFNTEH